MKVALAVNGFPVLSETFIYNQATALRAAGIDVSIVAAAGHGDPEAFTGAAAFDGPVHRAVLDRSVAKTARRTLGRLARGSARDLEILAAARRQFGASSRAVRAWLLALPLAEFDIVHLEYSGLAVSWLDALPLLAKTKIVVSCRGTAERITPLVDPARAERLRELFAIADRVHCVSRSMVATCERYGLDPAKAFVNHPAIDARRFTRSRPYVARTSGPFRLVSTGRLHWAKGLEFGLLAVRRLLDRGHDVHYEIIGGGPDEDRIRYAVHDLGLVGHVTFAGARTSEEVRTSLESADVYLLPSVSEGISNAALEAMAMEVPLVTTNVGGMTEAVTHGVGGWVVESRSADALAAGVEALLADPKRREQLGRAGRSRVLEAFSIDRQVATFVAEYASLMRRPRP